MFAASAADDATAGSWPFRRHVTPSGPTPPPRIRLRGLHQAFPAGQTSGTRLVLTQATAKTGENIQINRFTRYRVGEGEQ